MHILITGGTGFIGRAFIQQYYNQYKFTVLSRNPDMGLRHFELIPEADIHFIKQLSDLDPTANIDVVINLAGEPIMDKRWTQEQKNILEDSRWKTTQALVDLILDHRIQPKAFLSGSAIGYYGRQNDQIIDETSTKFFPEFSHHLCRRWEDIANTAASHTRVVLMRTGIVLAKTGGALPKMSLPFKLGLGGPIGDGKQYISWIHLHDMVNAIDFLIRHDVLSGPFHMTAPNPVTNKTFSKALAAIYDKPCFMTTPKWLLRLILGERADLVIYGQRVVPTNLLDAGFSFIFKDIESALKDY